MRENLMALGTMLLLLPIAAGQETYTLKISKPEQVGNRERRSVTESEDSGVIIQDATGKVLNEEKNVKQKAFIYEEKILAKEAGKSASKVSRTYENAVRIAKDQETDVGLKGKTVIIEFKDNKWQFAYADGGEVTGAAAEFLNDEFKNKDEDDSKMDEAVIPKKPVREGESWTCDVPAILKGMGKEVSKGVDATKVEAIGKLLKVYMKDGVQYGVIDVAISLPMKKFGSGEAAVKLDEGMVMKLKAKLDIRIDGEATEGTMITKMTMKGNGKVDAGGGEVTLKFDIAFSGTDTRKSVK
jgi:hypothetical protein